MIVSQFLCNVIENMNLESDSFNVKRIAFCISNTFIIQLTKELNILYVVLPIAILFKIPMEALYSVREICNYTYFFL